MPPLPAPSEENLRRGSLAGRDRDDDRDAIRGPRRRYHSPRCHTGSSSWAVAQRGWAATRRGCPTPGKADGAPPGREACGRLRARRPRRERARSLPRLPLSLRHRRCAEVAAAFGVAAALAFSPEETNLILAADVPRCPESFLAALIDVAEAIHAPAVVPVSGGRPQPLCAVWRRSALAPLRSRLGAGDYSLVAALQALHAVLIPEEVTAAMAGGAPENFFNVNTPEEYRGARNGSRGGRPGWRGGSATSTLRAGPAWSTSLSSGRRSARPAPALWSLWAGPPFSRSTPP